MQPKELNIVDDLVWHYHAIGSGYQSHPYFDNGYSASVVTEMAKDGLYEVMLLADGVSTKAETYSDPFRYLSPERLEKLLLEFSNFKPLNGYPNQQSRLLHYLSFKSKHHLITNKLINEALSDEILTPDIIHAAILSGHIPTIKSILPNIKIDDITTTLASSSKLDESVFETMHNLRPELSEELCERLRTTIGSLKLLASAGSSFFNNIPKQESDLERSILLFQSIPMRQKLSNKIVDDGIIRKHSKI